MPPYHDKSRRLTLLFAVAFSLILYVTTADKPVHLDDPLYVRVAERMLVSPADPHGFRINWEGKDLPASIYGAYHFPLWPSLIALPLRIIGDREAAMHLAQVPFTALALFSTALLATALRAPAWLALGLLAASPAFLVSATTLMPDVPCLALFLAGMLSIAGPGPFRPARSAVLLTMSGFMKLSAMALLPAVAAAAWIRSRSLLRTALVPGAALLILAAWPVFELVRAPAGTAFPDLPSWKFAWTPGALVAKLAYAGTAMALAVVHPGVWWVLLGARFRRRGTLRAGAAALGCAALFLGLAGLGAWEGRVPPVWSPPPEGASRFWALAGTFPFCAWLVLVAMEAWRERRSAPAGLLLLLAWVASALLGAVIAAPFAGVRYVLLGTPAVAILVARELVPWWKVRWGRAAVGALLAGTLWLGSAAAWADYRHARCVKGLVLTAVQKLKEDGSRGWLTAHWGLQYYGERLGLRQTETPSAGPRAGDVVIVAGNTFNHAYVPASGLESEVWLTLVCGDGEIPLRLMHPRSSAGFHGLGWLPYSFSRDPIERLTLHRIGSRRAGRSIAPGPRTPAGP